MDYLKNIANWLGIGQSTEERNILALRNMPIIAVGALIAGVFSGMLAFCILTGTPCPVNGFDEAAYETPATTSRFQVFCSIAAVIMFCFAILAIMYARKHWCRPHLAALLAVLFSLVFVMIWGVAESGRPPHSQVLIFASMQFLISGLIIFNPFVSLIYFFVSFSLFGGALELSGQMAGHGVGELAYLASLDLVVSWIVYTLFRRGVHRESAIADQSRRDELTGAKNRHYLRDDVESFLGIQHFIMLCDIDNFKHYNDEYNHDVGDDLLKDFYYALREAFGDECTYRYGGDEFLVVSPEFGEDEFRLKADRCAQQLKLVVVKGANAALTFSGGYVFGTPQHIEDFRNMLHEADKTLLDVKRNGKNHIAGHKFQQQP